MSEVTPSQSPHVRLTIDGREVAVPKGTTVYQAARKLNIEIPIFCYHEKMPPFGACRMCLVDVEKMPKLQTSCTLEAAEGMVIHTQSPKALDGRESILEFLLINHPLDCPICDKAGECPLQDQTLKHGPGESRFCEDKRQFEKRLPLGPVLMLDRERCISCARCTRFTDIVSGDNALTFIDRGHKTEVGTADGKPVESKFIGNTIMICPVGALTSQVYRFKARPWDNQQVESTCTLCPVGCSMTLDSRDGEITRTRSCESKVNDIWLCDKGWFGYEFASHGQRLTHPLIRRHGHLEQASWEEAFEYLAQKIKEVKPSAKLAALGGNALTVEENYLFQKFCREVLQTHHVDHRVGMSVSEGEDILLPGMESSLEECSHLSGIFVLGCDISEEFPLLWLRLKEAINKGAHSVFSGHFAPEVARHLGRVCIHPPKGEAQALAHCISDLKSLYLQGKKTAVFVGSQYLNSPHRSQILKELVRWRHEFPGLLIHVMEAIGNSMGARLAGMHPEFGPMGYEAAQKGMNILDVFETAVASGWQYLHVAGADPAAKLPRKFWEEIRDNLGFLVVQDLFLTQTASDADVVLPTLSFLEKEGSFLNIESRLQKIRPGKAIPEGLYSDGQIFEKLAHKLHTFLEIDPTFARLLTQEFVSLSNEKIAKPSAPFESVCHLEENVLYASFAPALFDTGNRMKHNKQLLELVKEPKVRISPDEAAKRNLREGSKARLKSEKGSLSVKVSLDRKVAKHTVVIPTGFDQLAAFEMGVNVLNGLSVVLESDE
jgi:NADH-quinone oxidoreductase subunit G